VGEEDSMGIILWIFFIVEIVRLVLALRLTEQKSGLKGDAHVRYRAFRLRSSSIFLASVLVTILVVSLMSPVVGLVTFFGGLTASAIFGSKASALKRNQSSVEAGHGAS
jgi:hypothetical protein